jgi:hypothetical protein
MMMCSEAYLSTINNTTSACSTLKMSLLPLIPGHQLTPTKIVFLVFRSTRMLPLVTAFSNPSLCSTTAFVLLAFLCPEETSQHFEHTHACSIHFCYLCSGPTSHHIGHTHTCSVLLSSHLPNA